MDPLVLVVALTFLFICISTLIFSIYAYIFFSHEKESPFPGIPGAVANIILSIFVSLNIFVVLPLDWINMKELDLTSGAIDIKLLEIWWWLLIISILLFLGNIFWRKYYNYDNPHRENLKDQEIKVRIKASVLEMFKFGIVLTVVLFFVTYVYGGSIKLPYHVTVTRPDVLIFSNLKRELVSEQTSQHLHISNLMPGWNSFIAAPFIFYGTLLLFIIGGFGMATVPISFIASYFKKPKKPNAENMVISDILILKDTEKGIRKLKNLIMSQEELEEIKKEGLEEKKIIKTKIENINIEIIQCQEMLIQLEDLMSARMRKHNVINENPLKYLFNLIFGIFSTFISFTIIIHTILSAFKIHVVLENIYFFLYSLSSLYSMFFFVFLSMYMLFCTIKGYEKLSEIFPQKFGHNQMKMNRTWIDTFLVIANIFIPSSWAILAYNLRFVPQFFNMTSASTFIYRFVMNIMYIKIFFRFRIIHVVLVLCFLLGLVITCSTSITTDYLDQRIEETKENLKYQQLEYYRNNKLQ
jgi:hypothetical protein